MNFWFCQHFKANKKCVILIRRSNSRSFSGCVRSCARKSHTHTSTPHSQKLMTKSSFIDVNILALSARDRARDFMVHANEFSWERRYFLFLIYLLKKQMFYAKIAVDCYCFLSLQNDRKHIDKLWMLKINYFPSCALKFFLQMESLQKCDNTWFELLLNLAILLTTSFAIDKKQHAIL